MTGEDRTVQVPEPMLRDAVVTMRTQRYDGPLVRRLEALLAQQPEPAPDVRDLPVGAVVRDADGAVWERAYVGRIADNDPGWFPVEFAVAVHDDALSSPVSVLFTPKPIPPHRYLVGQWGDSGMCTAIVDQDGGPGRCGHPRAHTAHAAGEARS